MAADIQSIKTILLKQFYKTIKQLYLSYFIQTDLISFNFSDWLEQSFWIMLLLCD